MSMFSMSSGKAGIGPGGCFFEGIQIDHHHIDRLDAVRGQRLHVRRLAAHRQDGAGHIRMHGLHAPVQHFRKAGHFRHVTHGHAGIAQQARSAAGRDQFRAQSRSSRANAAIPVLSVTLIRTRWILAINGNVTRRARLAGRDCATRRGWPPVDRSGRRAAPAQKPLKLPPLRAPTARLPTSRNPWRPRRTRGNATGGRRSR